MYRSLVRFHTNLKCTIYVVDDDFNEQYNDANLSVIHARRIPLFEHFRYEIKRKPDELRWTLKSYAIDDSTKNDGNNIGIWIDNDIFFVNNIDFALRDLDECGLYVTPHWRNPEPSLTNMQFYPLAMDGMFNAGFVGVNLLKGESFLKWWQRCCAYNCSISPHLGIMGDQRYLDLSLLYFRDIVRICDKRGCNLANWNIEYIDRSGIKPIFYHFTGPYIKSINDGFDDLSRPHYEEYSTKLEEAKNDPICK